MKTVLYDENSIINLQQFGIKIPSLKSRKTRTLEALLDDNYLAKTRDQWLVTRNPFTIGKKDLERVHSENYSSALYSEKLANCLIESFELKNDDGSFNRYIPEDAESPIEELFNQILGMAAGTYFAANKALETGFCYYLGGGMHHGHKDFGHGFCPINDIVVAARRIQFEKRAKKIWIIDLDAHKGDGTAELTQNDDSIRTFSIHMAAGWPLDTPEYDSNGLYNPGYFPSNIDISIKTGEEDSYLTKMKDGLELLENLSGSLEKPDLAIVLLGADPYIGDELESTNGLNLTEEDMLERDQILFNFLKARKIPSAYTMAGGYGHNSWKIHANYLKWALKENRF